MRPYVVSGILGGLIGAILMDVILVLSKIIMGLPALADFMVMGASLGDGIVLGVVAHHLVGIFWGIVLGVLVFYSRGRLIPSGDWIASIFYGSLFGLIVYSIFFTWVMVFLFAPTMVEMIGAERAAMMAPAVLALAALEHVVFGSMVALTISYWRK